MLEIYANIGWSGGEETENMLMNKENGFVCFATESFLETTLDTLKINNNDQPFNYVIFKDGIVLTKGVK